MTMSQNSKKFSSHLKFVLLLLVVSLWSNYTFAQGNITVTGKVTDPDTNVPLANVSVQVKGTSKGVVTNEAGVYSISAPAGSTLLFTYLTNTPDEVKVNKAGTVNVSLGNKPGSMDEVVVIGYGSRKKKDVTGAISTIGEKEIERSTAMTPELALQGTAAGVFIESGGGSPSARPTIRIRGVNTFGFSEPLYVVDGVPIFEGGLGSGDARTGDLRSPINIFSMINPNDIESLTVLKDASAAAIYGVRASNGVILITTKKGKKGSAKVDFSASYGIQNIAKTKEVLNTQQFFELLKEGYNNNPDANTTFAQRFGPLFDATNPTYVGNGPTYDWQKELLNRNAKIKDYNVKVSGGTDNTTFYFSTGYAKTESPLKANSLERFSIASNVETKVSKYVTAGLNLRLVQQTSEDNTNGDLSSVMGNMPFQPFYDQNNPTGFAAVSRGEFIRNPALDGPPVPPSVIPPAAIPSVIFKPGTLEQLWGVNSSSNIFAAQGLNSSTYKLLNGIGNAFVQVEPITGLKVKLSIGGQYLNNIRNTWNLTDGWRYSKNPGNPYSGQDGNGVGSIGERQSTQINLNKELTVNYNHTFNKLHSIDLLASVSNQFSNWNVKDISGVGNFLSPQFRDIQFAPGFTNGFAQRLQEDQLLGYLGRVSYKFSDKYYFDATLRYDGSSRLAPGSKFDYFPAFSAAWRISSERFFPKNSFINDLKIRGGWGKLGNFLSAGPYQFLSIVERLRGYATGGPSGIGSVNEGAYLSNFANRNLTWEKVKTTSIGLDAVLFNNRLNFTAEYYNKLTVDIIQQVVLPPNTGIESRANLNIASVRNTGFEFQLAYNKSFGDINFNASSNLTTVSNNVVRLNNGNAIFGAGGRIQEGYSMGYLFGYKVGGIFQSQAEIDAWKIANSDGDIIAGSAYEYKPGDMYFQNLHGDPRSKDELFDPTPDKKINESDRTYLGKTIPGFFYGFSFGAEYKGLDLNIFFQGVGDVQRYNGQRAAFEGINGASNYWATTLDRWTPTNKSTTIPRAVFGDRASSNRFSSRFVEDASYLRLKNIQLGYRLPASVLNKAQVFKGLRVFVSAINLLTVTNYTGLDPENDGIPPTRQFVLGLNASF